MATNKEIIHVGLKGAKKTKSGLKGIGTAALKMGAVFFAAKGIVTGMKTIVETGSKLKNTEMAFNNMGKSVGFTNDAMSKFKSATNGAVTELELMTKANNAMALGIVESEDQFANLLDTAQRLGAALGQDVGMSLDSLVTGMGRQSKLMLDNLGIIIDTEKAYADYGEEIGKTSSQLTDQEKKTAFNKATMLEANRIVAMMGEEQVTTSMKISKLKTTFMDMASSVGSSADGMFSSVVDASQVVADKLAIGLDFVSKINWAETMENFKNNLSGLGQVWGSVWKLVLDVFPDLFKNAVGKLIPILLDTLNLMFEAIKGIGGFLFEPLVIAFKMYINSMKKIWEIQNQWLGDAFEIVGTNISNTFTTIINGIKSGLNMLINVTNKLSGTEIKPFEMGKIVDVELMKENMVTAMDATKLIYDEKQQELKDAMQSSDMADFVKGFFMPDEDDVDTMADFNAGLIEIFSEFAEEFVVIEDQKKTASSTTANTIIDNNKKVVKSESELVKQRQGATQTFLSDLKLLGGESKKWSAVYKATESSKALVDTYRSAGAQFKAYSETYPAPFGQIAGVAAAAAAVAAGMVRVKQINAAATGADYQTSGPELLLVGDNPSGQERVQVTPLGGDPNINGPQGGGITLNISGNVMSEEFTESMIVPQIKEALRLGGDLGV